MMVFVFFLNSSTTTTTSITTTTTTATTATMMIASAAKSQSRNRNSHTPGFEQSISRIMEQSATTTTLIQPIQKASSFSKSSTLFNNYNRKRRTTALDEKTQPLRIQFFTDPIEQAISQSSVSAERQGGQVVLDTVLPSVQADFSSTISVEPITEGFSVPNSICDGIYSQYLPSTYNVDDADLLIIVSAFTTISDGAGNDISWCSTEPGASTLAAAASCGQDPTSKRPIVGLMNICLSATSDQNPLNMEEILAHELLHVLAVSEYLFPFYRNPVNGKAMTANPNVAQTIKCVNGKDPMNFYTFSSNTMQYRTESVKYNYGRERRGYYEITAPTVRQVVRNQFNCQSMTGARLENQPTNPYSCIGSHFDERFFQYNIMSAMYDRTSVHFTPLTLALLEGEFTIWGG